MARTPVRGLFITGTDTEIGKTYATALMAESLVRAGHRVGVYKPAASGCTRTAGALVSDDALRLWQAAGSPGTLAEVCPQVFAAAKAPHLAAADEGRRLDETLLRAGLDVWLARSDIVLVEGAGGLMSPLGDDAFVADLAYDLGFPLVVVADNRLGAINHVLQTLITAATFRDGLIVAGVVLNQATPGGDAELRAENARELRRRAVPPILAEVAYGLAGFEPEVDWFQIAAEAVARGSLSTKGEPA
ncbi:MAG: dethiobiotin synthase [Pirellulales bacterium]